LSLTIIIFLPEADFLVRVYTEPCLILSRAQILALLCSSKFFILFPNLLIQLVLPNFLTTLFKIGKTPTESNQHDTVIVIPSDTVIVIPSAPMESSSNIHKSTTTDDNRKVNNNNNNNDNSSNNSSNATKGHHCALQ
jgi:hypothetical protein